MFRRGPGRLEMCFYAYKNVLEPMGHLGANLIFSILTLNQVPSTDARAPAYAIMCCCPLGSSIPGAPNRASGEALGVGGRRRRPANAGRGVQLLTQPTGGEGFGILSSDAYSLQAAPPASCSSRCGSGLCSASVASVMKELTLLQHKYHAPSIAICPAAGLTQVCA